MCEEGELTMAKVLRVLLDDRQLREKELAEEHARQEEEHKCREEKLLEERARREEELGEEPKGRDIAMRGSNEMDLLRGLIEGVQRQGETAALMLETEMSKS